MSEYRFLLLNLHIEKRENHTAVNTKWNKRDCVVCEGELLGAQIQVNVCKQQAEKGGKWREIHTQTLQPTNARVARWKKYKEIKNKWIILFAFSPHTVGGICLWCLRLWKTNCVNFCFLFHIFCYSSLRFCEKELLSSCMPPVGIHRLVSGGSC